MPARLAILLLATPLLYCGVGNIVQKGINCYRAKNLPCAMSVWTELEPQETAMNEKGLCRYLVYRGLTEYRLHHREQAIHFLARGRQMYRNPRWLDAGVVQEMNLALADLQGGPQQPPAPQPPTPQPPAPDPAGVEDLQ